jgi:hypothetical protein
MSHEVLDLEVIPIGTLGPMDVKSFLAVASHYDNIYNIEDYEIIPRWDEQP